MYPAINTPLELFDTACELPLACDNEPYSIAFPVVAISLVSVLDMLGKDQGKLYPYLQFIGHSNIAMLIAAAPVPALVREVCVLDLQSE